MPPKSKSKRAPPPAPDQAILPFAPSHSFAYLQTLNKNQREAVEHSPQGGLQILAGPGSGKTKVLTSRVAYLIQFYEIQPEDIVVVTFTNKAAQEMRHRLEVLVGKTMTDRIVMGTFHSVCVRYLRKYHKLVDLPQGFTIADRDGCLALLKSIMSPLASFHPTTVPKPPTILDFISKQKSLGLSPEQARAVLAGEGGGMSDSKREEEEWKVGVFEAYEKELKGLGAVDFDDLLGFGLQLFKGFPQVVKKIQCVLIDEFQDTNVVQFDIVKYMSAAKRNLTIVGDPDQSIYGWRHAEVENLEKMTREFRPVRQIFLEENYRSTGAILGAALAVVQQDKSRVKKTLIPTHPTGTSVVLSSFPTALAEAQYIAYQTKFLVAHSGAMIDYGDVAVLLRFGALSRNLEMEFKKAGVPCRLLGGHKFFDRVEVKDILAYLQLVDNTSYTPALLRVINVPKRGLGDKSIKDLLEASKRHHITPFEMILRTINGSTAAGFTEGMRKRLKEFVLVVRETKRCAEEGATVAELIEKVVELCDYTGHLERAFGGEVKERLENINELKAYATVVAEEAANGTGGAEGMASQSQGSSTNQEQGLKAHKSREDLEAEMEASDSEEFVLPPSSQVTEDGSDSPLRNFLAVSMLATDNDTEDSKQDANQRVRSVHLRSSSERPSDGASLDDEQKVTISTCHAAKGLEWPVVFVPACEDGVYPFYRCSELKEQDEERRLLYVAITRAKVFCTLTHAETRMVGSDAKGKVLTPFLSGVSKQYPTLFKPKLQKLTAATRVDIGRVLGKVPVSEEESEVVISQFTGANPEPVYAPPAASFQNRGGFNSFSSQRYSGSSFSRHGAPPSQGSSWQPYSQQGPRAVPSGAGFSSALSSVNPARVQKPPVVVTRVVPGAGAAAARPAGMSKPFVPPRINRPSEADSATPPPPAPLATKTTNGTTSGHGSLTLPETRASRINDVVLLNPVVKPPGEGLLASFQSSEAKALQELRDLGNGEEVKKRGAEETSEDVGRGKRKKKAVQHFE